MPVMWEVVNPIRGWLERAEAEVLHTLAVKRTVLEIGSYCGRSTVAMALSANLVVSIDHHKGDAGTGPGDTLVEFLNNLDTCKVRHKVVPIVAPRDLVSKVLSPNTFDMVFIDAAHDYNSVMDDIDVAKRVLKPGGIVAYHDYHVTDVRHAAEDSGWAAQFQTVTLGWLQT